MTDPLPPFRATDPDVYEHFMGRWSARLAKPFLEFASIRPNDRVLDVGSGTGTLSLALAQHGAKVIGMDASESYLEGARRRRSHANVTYEHATGSFDACVSTLAIDVIPDVEQVAAEMRRVARPGGVVACGTWGGNSVLDLVLDTGAVLDESIRTLRSQIKARPIVWANGQADLWRKAGLVGRCRSSSASITLISRTTGPASRPGRRGSHSILSPCRLQCRARLSSMFKPAIWLAYQMGLDRLRSSSVRCAG
jgi:SAM-dependent methyltransferase